MLNTYFILPNDLFKQSISAYAKVLYAMLKRLSNKEGHCYPSRNKITKECGFSITTYKKAIKELTDNNLIQKQERFRQCGGQSTNLYILINRDSRYFTVRSDVFNLELTTKSIITYLYLLACKGMSQNCYPSYKKIAGNCTICESYVKMAVVELQEKGIIYTQNQTRIDGGNTTLLYTFEKETKIICEDISEENIFLSSCVRPHSFCKTTAQLLCDRQEVYAMLSNIHNEVEVLSQGKKKECWLNSS